VGPPNSDTAQSSRPPGVGAHAASNPATPAKSGSVTVHVTGAAPECAADVERTKVRVACAVACCA
jgi:hypothetical protein